VIETRDRPHPSGSFEHAQCLFEHTSYDLSMQMEMRHREILDELRRSGRVEVEDLADNLGTSSMTIRRDLEHLAGVGALRRVRGGAVGTALHGEGLPFSVRAVDGEGLKGRLAAAAVAHIADGEAVVVDSGTTGAAAAAELAQRRVTAMPLSVQGIAALSSSQTVNLVLPGGTVRGSEGTIVGPIAERTIASLRFDTALLTCCAADPDAGVTAFDIGDAAIKQALIAASSRVILIAEGAKFSLRSMAIVCALEDVDVVVTDASAPAIVLDRLRAAGVEVTVV
jgi:DeoR/GlpR family transcriptional regulator of sugar metabolism